MAVSERVSVPFEGEGSGTAELSWGQQSIWAEMRRAGKALTMTAVRQLDEGAKVDEFVDELRFYLSRYQAMRTLLRFEPDGRILQVVKAAGVAEIEIFSADDRDPAEVVQELTRLHTDTRFDYEREWPIRLALVRRDGALTHAVVTFAHHMADATSAMAMFTDLQSRDPLTGEPPRPPGIQPLAQALQQQTPAARRQNDAALRHWETQLRVIPPSMFTKRPTTDGCWEADFLAPAWEAALRATAARLRLSTGTILYTAFAVALAQVTGVNPVATMITVNNRFRPGLANAAGHMVQHGLCTLDTSEGQFGELALKARHRLLAAQKNAYYSQSELDELIERVGRERGVTFDLYCLYNDRRGEDAPLPDEADMRQAATIEWRPLPSLHQRFMFHVNDRPGTVSALLQMDTAYFSRADVAALLDRMETLVFGA